MTIKKIIQFTAGITSRFLNNSLNIGKYGYVNNELPVIRRSLCYDFEKFKFILIISITSLQECRLSHYEGLSVTNFSGCDCD